MSNVLRFPERAFDEPQEAAQVPKESPRGPQVEDGYTRIANELLDALCAADFTAREFRVVHFVIRQTYGWNDKAKRMAASFIAGGTGLHESHCSKVLNELIRRNVVVRHGGSRSPVSLNKHFDQWLASESGKKIAPTTWPESGQDGLAQSGQDGLTKKDRKDMTDTDVSERIGEPTRESSSADESPAKKSSLPDCPHMEILDLWAEVMPDKPQPAKNLWQGTARASHLANRWKAGFTIKHERTGEPLYTDRETGIAWWGRFFNFLRKSDFLMGDHRWFKLEWVAKRENFVKIMEMSYHGGDA